MEALSQSRSTSHSRTRTTRSSRRSSRPQTPTHFSLAPLTPRFPFDDNDDDDDVDEDGYDYSYNMHNRYEGDQRHRRRQRQRLQHQRQNPSSVSDVNGGKNDDDDDDGDEGVDGKQEVEQVEDYFSVGGRRQRQWQREREQEHEERRSGRRIIGSHRSGSRLSTAASTSYLTSTSMPTTPRILSRSSSRTRLNVPALTPTYGGGGSGMTKSKSSAYLLQEQQRQHHHHATTGMQISKPKPSANICGKGKRQQYQHQYRQQDGEWMLRAGLAITTETREAKGQSWLAQRDSSTSLVSQEDEEDDYDVSMGMGRGRRMRAHGNGGGGGASARGWKSTSKPGSPMLSRGGSRTRVASGSGTVRPASDLRLPSMTSVTSATAGADAAGDERKTAESSDNSASNMVGMAPDFVDPQPDLVAPLGEEDADENYSLENAMAMAEQDEDDDSEAEGIDEVEREMQKLARERGFGLGSLVDRVLGWTLFENNEDDLTTPTAGPGSKEGQNQSQSQRLSKTRPDVERKKKDDDDDGEEEEGDNGGMEVNEQDNEVKDEKENVIREAGMPRDSEGDGEGGGDYTWHDTVWLARVVRNIIS